MSFWTEIFKAVGMKLVSGIGDSVINSIKEYFYGSQNELEEMMITFRDDLNTALVEQDIREISGEIQNASRNFGDYYDLMKDYFTNPYNIPSETLEEAKERLYNASDLFDSAITRIEKLGLDGFALYLVSTPTDLLVKKEKSKYIADYETIYHNRIKIYIEHINSLFDKWPKATENLHFVGTAVPRTRFNIHKKCIDSFNRQILPSMSVLKKWGKIIRYTSPYLYCRFKTRHNTYVTCCDQIGHLELKQSSSVQPPNIDQVFLVKNLEKNIEPIRLSQNRSYIPLYHNNKISIQVRTREYIQCIEGTGAVQVFCVDEPTSVEIFNIEKIRGSLGDLIRPGDLIALKTNQNYYFNFGSGTLTGHPNCSHDWNTSDELFHLQFYL